MSLRDTENPHLIASRWTASMTGHVVSHERARVISPRDQDAATRRAEANNKGADAWSPSRAREALRAWLLREGMAFQGAMIEARAEESRAFDHEESFGIWSWDEFGEHGPTV